MKTYRHLSRNERDEIAVLVNRGHSLRRVAFYLGRSHSSLVRELKRNKGQKHYRPADAHLAARKRQKNSHRRPKRLLTDAALRARVTHELTEGWSPEIIAGRLRREFSTNVLSHEAIYRWIYADAKPLIKSLVRSHPHRRPRWSRPWPSRLIPRGVSVHERPLEVNLRQVPGHWEADHLCGPNRVSLQVLVERQTRFALLRRVPNKTPQATFDALSVLFSSVHVSLRHSVTYDNGFENALYAELNQLFNLRSYFCAPYHSWEKGTVENTNGLIRRFLPKSTNLDTIPARTFERIQHWLNNRPRKCLNFQTPAEAYFSAGGALAR